MLQLQPTKKCGINSCLVSSKNEKMKLKLNVSGGGGGRTNWLNFFSRLLGWRVGWPEFTISSLNKRKGPPFCVLGKAVMVKHFECSLVHGWFAKLAYLAIAASLCVSASRVIACQFDWTGNFNVSWITHQ